MHYAIIHDLRGHSRRQHLTLHDHIVEQATQGEGVAAMSFLILTALQEEYVLG